LGGLNLFAMGVEAITQKSYREKFSSILIELARNLGIGLADSYGRG
jgi:hypothetical protein